MSSIHILDYIERENGIYGVEIDTYDQEYHTDERWWSMRKLFKPPMFKGKKFPYYNKNTKKEFIEFKKHKRGKGSNFTKDEITAVKSIFTVPGNIIVCRSISDNFYKFFENEFDFSLNDCKDNIYEIDATGLEMEKGQIPFICDNIYQKLKDAAIGDGEDWAEGIISKSGFVEEKVDGSNNKISEPPVTEE